MITYVLLTRFEVHNNSPSNPESDVTIELATPSPMPVIDRALAWAIATAGRGFRCFHANRNAEFIGPG